MSAPVLHKKRRWLRWLVVLSLIVLLLPLLAFFGILGYIKLGYLNAPVAQNIGAMFDTQASVKNVSSPWLQGLKIDTIRVESTDPARPLTIDSVLLDWKISELYNEQHLRSIQINRPKLNLCRNEKGDWNLGLKPAESTAPALKIDQLQLNDGDFLVEWAAGRSAHFQALSGALNLSSNAQEPKSFSLQGQVTSLEHFQWDGTLGPRRAWSANAKGSLFLEKDLALLTGPAPAFKGHLRYEAQATRADGVGRPIDWSGKVLIEHLHWPLTSAPGQPLELFIPSDNLNFQAQLCIPESPFPVSIPGAALDVEVWALDNCRLDAGSIGSLTFNAVMNPKPAAEHLILSGGVASLDLDALAKLFTASPTGEYVSFSGKASIKNTQMLLPLTENAPPLHASGILETSALSCRLKDFGTLPPLEVFCEMDWPTIKEARLKMGDLATAKLKIEDLRFPGTDLWHALSKNVCFKELKLDLGRLFESDAGRCLLSGVSDRAKAPALSEFPFVCKGLFDAQNFTMLAENRDQQHSIVFSKVSFNDVSISRCPLNFPIHNKTLFGQIDCVRATLSDPTTTVPAQLKQWEFFGKISTTTAEPNELPTECTVTLEKNLSGRWGFGKIFVNHIRSPIEDIDSIFNVTQCFGVKSTGNVILKDTTYFPESVKLESTLALENIRANFPVPLWVSALGVQLLQTTHHEMLALGLQLSPITEASLNEINARFKVSLADGQLQVSGQIDPMVFKLPLTGEQSLATLQKINVLLKFDLFGKTPRKVYLSLGWGGADAALNHVECQTQEIGDGVWKLIGSVQLGNEGLTVNFETSVDLKTQKLGPLVVTCGDLDLAKVGPALQRFLKKTGLPGLGELSELSGDLKKFKLEVDALKWTELSLNKIPYVRLSGNLERAGLKSPALDLSELTGPFDCKLSYDGGRVESDLKLEFSSCEALLHQLDGFKLPPTLSGSKGTLLLANEISRGEDGSMKIRLVKGSLTQNGTMTLLK